MDTQVSAHSFAEELEQMCPDMNIVVAEVNFMGRKRHSVRIQYLTYHAHFFVLGRSWVMLRVFPSGEKKTDDLEIKASEHKSAQASIIYFLAITAKSIVAGQENQDFGQLLLGQCKDALYLLSTSAGIPRKQRSHAKFLLANLD